MNHQGTAQDRRQVRYECVFDEIYIMQHNIFAYRHDATSKDRDQQLRQSVIGEAKEYYSRFVQSLISDHTMLELNMYEAYDQGQEESLPQAVVDTVPDTVTRDEFLLKPFLHTRSQHSDQAYELLFFDLLIGPLWSEDRTYRDDEQEESMINTLLHLLGALAHRQRLFSVVHTLVAYHNMLVPRCAPPGTFFTIHELRSSLSMYLVLTYNAVHQSMAATMEQQDIPVAWQSPLVLLEFSDMLCDYEWFQEVMQDEYTALVLTD